MSSTVLPRHMRSTWLIQLGRMTINLVHAYRRQRAVTALSHLSDHQLRDIGVSRSQIEHAVRHGRFD